MNCRDLSATHVDSMQSSAFVEDDLQLQPKLADHLKDRCLVRLPRRHDGAADGSGAMLRCCKALTKAADHLVGAGEKRRPNNAGARSASLDAAKSISDLAATR
jgi:hypothetical protein